MEDQDKPTKKLMPWHDANKKEKKRREDEDGDMYNFSDNEQEVGDGGDDEEGAPVTTYTFAALVLAL